MNPNDFKIVFASEKHEVDIETLIGCLMHTSNIIQEVNRSLGTEKKIEVKIKALEQGSFEIHIELIEKLLDSIFSKDNINISAEIISVVAGLYSFVKWLKSKIKKTEKVDDGVEVTLENGDKTTININVYNTFNESKIVRESIAKQISALEKNKDISGFKFESNETNVYISDEEFSSVVKTISSLNSEAKEPIKDILEDRKILIIRPSFDKDLKWDFVFDGQKISAKMNDEAMIKVIDNGEQFAKGDYMLVDIEVTKFYDNDLGVHLITKDSYKILRYKEHIKIEQVGKLF
jgi:hypothetical protein